MDAGRDQHDAYQEPHVEDYDELQLLLGPARRKEPEQPGEARLGLVQVSDATLP